MQVLDIDSSQRSSPHVQPVLPRKYTGLLLHGAQTLFSQDSVRAAATRPDKEKKTWFGWGKRKEPVKKESNLTCLCGAHLVYLDVKHAYNGKPTGDTMRVEISFKDNQLIIEIYDKGKPVIPENIKPRKIDDIKPGGLGTFFIGQIMDEVTFKTSASDWVNHLIMTKNY